MSPETIFNICNIVALIGWIVLLIIPFWDSSDKLIVGIIITMLALVYAWLIFSEFRIEDAGNFGSVAGVQELFANPKLLVAGWVHYLAFDLMAGLFIKKNSVKHGISHWYAIPCLIFTFMLGPIGLLLYFIIRWIITRQYFAENF
jgi:hypothetical protein